MFGDTPQNDQNGTPQTDAPQPVVTPTATPTDSAGEYMLEDGSPATASAPSVPATADAPTSQNTDELLDVKRQALQQLTPLLEHLDQSPRDAFRTTMMMIQATDDDTLIKKAYDAASKIDDDKERAQALLDVVNEINYFTQSHTDAE